MPVVRFNGKKLDPATIRALVSGTLVAGSKPSVWWNRQSLDFRNSFMDTMRTSMRNGESLTQAITRVVGGTVDGVSVPGIMKTTKGRAGALVATAQSAVTNEAALKTFQKNNDVIKAVSQLSTMDNRTSDICVAYSGQTWDVNTLSPIMGSSLPFNGGPPRHFNCRSRLRPVTKSFKELGIDADEIPAGTRASMDGQIPSDITFNQFLKSKPNSFADDLLGPRRAQLYRDGDITLTQLVDMRGNPMTIAQLEQKVGITPKVTPKPPVPSTTKKVPSFLDDVMITEAEHAEITAHAKRLVKAADEADELVTKQVKGLSKDIDAKFPDAAIVEDGPLVKDGSLHFRLKDTDSTSRKIQTYARDRNLTFTEAADQISDSLRYTYVLDEDDYVRAIQEAMEKFAELGYKNNKFDPAWLLRPDYKGLNINLVSPQGVRMELQFHTATSFEVKQNVNHVLYEKLRKLSKAKKAGPEGQALQAEMLANSQAIPVPKNIQFLEDLAKIYNNPSVKEQNKIFAAAKRRQLAAERKVARKKAADKRKAEAKETRERKAREKKALDDQKKIEKEIAAAKEKEAMTVDDAVKSALDGKFQKLGETQDVIDLHVASYGNAPSYIKNAIGLRKPLNAVITEYELTGQNGGAFFRKFRNEIWMNSKSHPNAIGRNATWRHEYGHAVDYDLAEMYYRLTGTTMQMDQWGVPIISARFNKSLLADSRKFQKWQSTKFRNRNKPDAPNMSLIYDRAVTEHATKSFEVGRKAYYDPLLKKHGMTYDQVKDMARRNFDLPAGHRFDNYVDDFLIPNMLASIETGNVQGFMHVATNHLFKGGGDLASMSDYIGSITKNKIRGSWGHSSAYYSARQHGITGKHKEAFANFFGMMGGEDAAFFESLIRAWGADKFLDDLIDAMKLLEKG